jgi:hypothetical protein
LRPVPQAVPAEHWWPAIGRQREDSSAPARPVS